MRSPPGTTSSANRRAAGRRSTAATDRGRDQSYFLFATTRDQLAFLRFPLGRLTKAETRAIAGRLGSTDRREEGQPGHLLRAVGRLRRRDRAASAGGAAPGDIVDRRWPGARRAPGDRPLYRRPAARDRRRPDRPLYVIRLEPAKARVVVGPFEALLRDHLRVRDVNWLGDETPPVADSGRRGEAALDDGAGLGPRVDRRRRQRRGASRPATGRSSAGPSLRLL